MKLKKTATLRKATVLGLLSLPFGFAMLSNQASAQDDAAVSSSATAATLPDAPGFTSAAPAAETGFSFDKQPVHVYPPAGHHDKYIEPGQAAPKLSSGDKFVLGIKDALSIDSIIGWGLSAGYAQIRR